MQAAYDTTGNLTPAEEAASEAFCTARRMLTGNLALGPQGLQPNGFHLEYIEGADRIIG
jgi:hypothetical protein